MIAAMGSSSDLSAQIFNNSELSQKLLGELAANRGKPTGYVPTTIRTMP
jgi:hypothetical protein